MKIDLRDYQKWNISVSLCRSKSVMIRLLIYYYLKNRKILPLSANDSDDVKIVHKNLQIINNQDNKNLKIPIIIDVRDCGTAYRFFLSVLAVTEGFWLLTGTQRLLSRPILPLIEALVSIGASIQFIDNGLLIFGKKLMAKTITIDCSETGQFASSLLLIKDFIGLQDIRMIPEKPASFSYISMTEKVMKMVDQSDKEHPDFEIENDWSAAAFWYALTALSDSGECELQGLRMESWQSDSMLSQLFESFNVSTVPSNKGLKLVKSSNLADFSNTPLSFDLSDNPDIALILAVLAVLLRKDISLTGLQNLDYKESKRLELLKASLSFIASVTIKGNNSIEISQIKECQNRELHFNTYGDHRFVMAFSLFAIKNIVELTDFESVSKSYPNFQEDLNKIMN